MTSLGELATLVRSKNAGPFQLTFDILFDDPAAYRRVRDAGVITRELIGHLYGTDPNLVKIFAYDPGLGIKATIPRPYVSGDLRDSDVMGGQQYGPLVDLRIPD